MMGETSIYHDFLTQQNTAGGLAVFYLRVFLFLNNDITNVTMTEINV
jgi:hypothetical protein